MLFKAERNAYEVANNLLFQSIDQSYLESLFRDHDFLSYSGTLRIEALYRYFSLSYTPLHAIAAIKIANPSLPEMTGAGVEQSVYRLTSGHRYENIGFFKELSVGASVFRYDRTFLHIDTNILEVAVRPADEILKKQDELGVDGDIGLAAKTVWDFIPQVGITVENLAKSQPKRTERLDIVPYFRQKSAVGLGYHLDVLAGKVGVGVNLPFWGIFETYDTYATSLAAAYQIGYLESFTSFSPFAYSFGFIFSSIFYKVGIQYSNEKQHNTIQFERKNHVYLFASFKI